MDGMESRKRISLTPKALECAGHPRFSIFSVNLRDFRFTLISVRYSQRTFEETGSFEVDV